MTDSHLPALPDQISFASELIKARGELGLTQAQLSEKSGLSLSAIKAYESGRNMPGARELRELCQALQVSPNKLLFGTEIPFQPRTVANMLVDNDSDDQAVFRVRLVVLANMLAADERAALMTLAHSIALARHGEEKIRDAIIGADLMAGMSRGLMKSSRDALNTGKDPDPEAMAKSLEDFMDRQGHIPNPNKLPEK